MQFLTNLFGGENTLVTVILALGIVLVLIVAAVWVLKFVFRATSSASSWGRNRLMVVEKTNIDPKRQLVIVRRDNVEHVILTGGPQDMIIESGIPVDKNGARRPVPIPVALNSNGQRANPFVEPEDEKSPAKGAIDRLKEFTRPLNQRGTSLRHTGLMRPVSKMDVIPGGANDRGKSDSAKAPVPENRGPIAVGEAAHPRDEAAAGRH